MAKLTLNDVRGYKVPAILYMTFPAYFNGRDITCPGISVPVNAEGFRSNLFSPDTIFTDYGQAVPAELLEMVADSMGVTTEEALGEFGPLGVIDFAVGEIGLGEEGFKQFAMDHVAQILRKRKWELNRYVPAEAVDAYALRMIERDMSDSDRGYTTTVACLKVTRSLKEHDMWMAGVPKESGMPLRESKLGFGNPGVLRREMRDFATHVLPTVRHNLNGLRGVLERQRYVAFSRDIHHTADVLGVALA